MRVLLTGGSGQLGFELKRELPAEFILTAPTSKQLDIRCAAQVASVVRELKPELIINAAAFTAVDMAEQNQEQVFAVNETGVKHLAQWGAPLFYLSTDYVFNGDLQRPYLERDKPAPLNSYGQSKLAGEQQLAAVNPHYLILRTSGLFGVHGHNFVKAILNKAQNGELISVVSDQFTTPTPARALAKVLWQLAQRYQRQGALPWGIYHLAGWPPVSWYEFAQVIVEQAYALGLLKQLAELVPIQSKDYPSAARRPRYSALDSRLLQRRFVIAPLNWQEGLRQMLTELMHTAASGSGCAAGGSHDGGNR